MNRSLFGENDNFHPLGEEVPKKKENSIFLLLPEKGGHAAQQRTLQRGKKMIQGKEKWTVTVGGFRKIIPEEKRGKGGQNFTRRRCGAEREKKWRMH